jgi:competence protein ComEA
LKKSPGIVHQLMEYLLFGKSERIAIVTVILLIIVLILFPALHNRMKHAVSFNDPSFEKEIEAFLRQEENAFEQESKSFDFVNPDREVFRRNIHPFRFDPNTLDKQGWIRMGFTEKQASGIIRFREKGGRFRQKEDVKKLYAVSEEVYNILEPFITLEETKPLSVKGKVEYPERAHSSMAGTERYKAELNSADSAELVKVFGIGPATARRIIRYREKLGGFAFIEQLREVAGIDSARFEVIKTGVFTDPDVVKKIEINKASVTQLRQHPYIDYYIAKAIVDNRIRKGSYTSADELTEIPLIYESLFNKLKPYISVDQ